MLLEFLDHFGVEFVLYCFIEKQCLWYVLNRWKKKNTQKVVSAQKPLKP